MLAGNKAHAPPRSHAELRQAFALGAAIAVLTLLFYLPALRAGFVWDDPRYITENPQLRSVAGLWRIWFEPRSTIQYYPLVFSTFWVEHHLWGDRPFGYHLNNILLHGLNSILLWRLLVRLGVPGAWFAGAIFALHPVHVPSVAWAVERKDVLSGAFFFLSLISWVRFIETPNRKLYGVTIALFTLMLLSKAATLPAAGVLLLVLWWRRGRLSRTDLLSVLPFFVLSAAMGLLHVRVEQRILNSRPEPNVGPPLERLLVAGRALWFYAGKLAWPAPLMALYPRWEMSGKQVGFYLFPLTAALVPLVLFICRKRIGRGPFVAAAFFGIMLAPALGLVSGGFFRLSFVSDHFQYLGGAGLIALFAACAERIAERLSRGARYATAIAAAGILGVFGALTWARAATYESMETLFRHDLEVNPGSWYAALTLGSVYHEQGREEEAVAMLERAIALKPDSYEAHSQLASVDLKVGRTAEAIQHCEMALKLNPNYPAAYINMAAALAAEGKTGEALASIESALRIEPENIQARRNRELLLQKLGRRN